MSPFVQINPSLMMLKAACQSNWESLLLVNVVVRTYKLAKNDPKSESDVISGK